MNWNFTNTMPFIFALLSILLSDYLVYFYDLWILVAIMLGFTVFRLSVIPNLFLNWLDWNYFVTNGVGSAAFIAAIWTLGPILYGLTATWTTNMMDRSQPGLPTFASRAQNATSST